MKALTTIVVALSLASCGLDPSAGKTTTTGNGLVPLNGDGEIALRMLAVGSHGWDTSTVRPTDSVVLHIDGDGRVELGNDRWAFVQVTDTVAGTGILLRSGALPSGGDRKIRLRPIIDGSWNWPDHPLDSGAVAVVESSFVRSALGADGSFRISPVPGGDGRLLLVGASGRRWEAGRLSGVSLQASINLLDPTGPLPLLIDDFERGFPVPALASTWPGTSRWHIFPKFASMVSPIATDSVSLTKACVNEGTRGGKVFSIHHQIDSSLGYVAAQVSFPVMDLSNRRTVCFGFRSDRRVKVEFLGPTTDSGSPGFSLYVPESFNWSDTCVATNSLAAQPQNPDSLKTWSAFGRSVGVLQFLATPGSTYLELDDIVLDRR